MRIERNPGAVYFEAAMFAGMVAIIGTGLLMVMGGFGWLTAVAIGAAIFVVVYLVLSTLLKGTLEPPRGPGNIRPTKTAEEIDKDPSDQQLAVKPSDAPSPAAATAAPAMAAPAPALEPAAAPEPAAAMNGHDAVPVEGEKPQTLEGARDGDPDDLKQIKGVGPKLESLLHSMGFYHFDQIANWSDKEVAWVDQNLEGFKGRVSRDDWVSQARHLAAGGTTEFSERVQDGEVY